MNSLLDSLAKPPPPPSELEELFNRMAEDPTLCTARDIDATIAFQRQARARREAGGRTKKAQSEQPKQAIDLAALGLTSKPVAVAPAMPTAKPASGGFRRI